MPTQKKIELVAELAEQIQRSIITIAADYSGLTVPEISKLRQEMREAGVEMRVVKNRLFLRAAQAAEKPEMAELLDGPTAIIFGYDDIAAPARVATEYMRTARNSFAVRKGVMDGEVLSLADLEDLGTLPPRDILISQVLGAIQGPLTRLAGLFNRLLANPPGRLLNDSMQTFTGLLEARANQLEGA